MVRNRGGAEQPMTITEVKHHLDGREEEFECELLFKSHDTALVRFAFQQDNPRVDGPFRLPAGEIVTLAAFWEDRPYLIYRLLDHRWELIGHRFDVCEDVHIDDEIHYTDLLLDVWVPADGAIHVLDADEVEAARSNGLMNEKQATIVDEARRHLERHSGDVVQELDQLMATANVTERAEKAEHQPDDG